MQAASEEFNRVDRHSPPAPTARTARCIAVNYEDHAAQGAAAVQVHSTGTGYCRYSCSAEGDVAVGGLHRGT